MTSSELLYLSDGSNSHTRVPVFEALASKLYEKHMGSFRQANAHSPLFWTSAELILLMFR